MNDQTFETDYPDKDLTSVHINLPTRLWDAVKGVANYLGTTKTNVVVRALDNHVYFMQVLKDDPRARVAIEHGDGAREYVSFPEVSHRARAPVAAAAPARSIRG